MLEEDYAMVNTLWMFALMPILYSILNDNWDNALWPLMGPALARFKKVMEVGKTNEICHRIAREAGIIP